MVADSWVSDIIVGDSASPVKKVGDSFSGSCAEVDSSSRDVPLVTGSSFSSGVGENLERLNWRTSWAKEGPVEIRGKLWRGGIEADGGESRPDLRGDS